MSRRVRLNPCDYLFWGQHRLNARKGEGGNVAYMLLDLDGVLDPNWLQNALTAVMRAHPATMGRFGSTLLLGRPQWRVPGDPTAAEAASRRAIFFEDYRKVPNAAELLDTRSRVGNIAGWDTRNGPLVRLELYALPDNRSRLILRWPHALMDAEGAQWFLNELTRCEATATFRGSGSSYITSALEWPSGLAADAAAVDPLSNVGFVAKWGLFRKGISYQGSHSKHRINLLPPESKTGPVDHQAIHRNWSAEQTTRVQQVAKANTPAGPALYARNLAACVVRAIHRLYTERGIATDAYLITLPTRVGLGDDARRLFERRPMIGNYLISPMLCIPREMAEDRQAVGEVILAQLAEYQTIRGDLLHWSMMWAASLIHAWVYELIFLLPLGSGRFASGFSFYGEIDQPVRRIGPARVLNLWGGGPNTSPPALNPVFSRFDDRLNFSLTYTRPAVSDATADAYVRLIESEMFDQPPADL